MLGNRIEQRQRIQRDPANKNGSVEARKEGGEREIITRKIEAGGLADEGEWGEGKRMEPRAAVTGTDYII